MDASKSEKIFNALESFRIELPSWGFANTGTRFGKFIQPAAATTTEEKFSDAGQVHLLTGVCPTIALHVLWDCPDGLRSTDAIKKFAERYRVLPGSINPNLFQDQEYKFGSFGNPDPAIRAAGLTTHQGQYRDRPPPAQPRYFHVVCGRLKLSGHSQYPATQAMVH